MEFDLTRISRLIPTCLVSLSLFPGTALSAPVDNPGFFAWATGTGSLSLNESSSVDLPIPNNSGGWETDIDSDGDITMWTMTIGAVSVAPYTIQVLVTADASTGTLDASLSSVTLSLRLRIRITGGNVGSSCITSSFDVPFHGFYLYDNQTSLGEAHLYTGVAPGAAWVTVPALSPTACNSQGSALNSMFGFGVLDGGLRIERLGAQVAGGPFGS